MVLIVFRYQAKWKVVLYCKLLTFLTNYQIDKPMVCFLATDLSAVLWDPMKRFIKDDLLCERTKIEKLMLMGVEEKSNQNSYKKIDVGFCTESALRNAQNVHVDVQNAFFDLVKILLVLLHGQASVERGYSVNKEIEVENLREHSLVAQRIICDDVEAVGGVLRFAKRDHEPKAPLQIKTTRKNYSSQ